MNLKKLWWLALAAIVLVLVVRISNESSSSSPNEEKMEAPIAFEPATYLTLPTDTLSFEKHTIVSGESFGALLGKRGIGSAKIYEVAAAVKQNLSW